ncbi:MAG: PliI family lysozyme inhibitor of I-type lysozyme [Chthoniobacterales bacterium]
MRTFFLFPLLAVASQVFASSYDETVRSGDLSFHVVASDSEQGSKVTVTPSGLKNSNDPQSVQGDGSLTETILEDLNGDNIPELFLVFTGEGSGSYGQVKAFSTNGGKVLTDIVIDEPKAADMQGYMGHDEFEVVEGTFVRRFPVYKPGDTNAKPTGGWRQIQYKLKSGEAAWHLRIDRVASF